MEAFLKGVHGCVVCLQERGFCGMPLDYVGQYTENGLLATLYVRAYIVHLYNATPSIVRNGWT